MMKMVIKDKGNRLEGNTQWERMHLDQILEDAGDLSTMYPEDNGKMTRPEKDRNRDSKSGLNIVKEKPRVEMVDRGVGPSTPGPAPISNVPFSPLLGWPPCFVDPRGGYFDPGCPNPFLYPPVGYHPYNHAIPINSSTNEGRYHWPPGPSSLNIHGSSSRRSFRDRESPAPSNVRSTSVSMQGPLPGESAASFNLRLQWEQHQRALSYHSHQRHASSFVPAGPSDDGYHPMHSPYVPYPTLTSHGHRISFDHPPTPGSGSITLPGSLQSSRITSPWPSMACRMSRKRAFSHSPSEFGFDIESLTRSSEASLKIPVGRESRGSSNASGSYGHLSAMALGSFSPAFGPLGHLRQNSLSGMMPPPPPALYNPMMHPGMNPYLMYAAGGSQAAFPPNQNQGDVLGFPSSKPAHQQVSTTTRDADLEPSRVSSTVQGNNIDVKKIKMKKETDFSIFSDSNLVQNEAKEEDCPSPNDPQLPQEGEPDFYETKCHWKDCTSEFDTQEDLVKHLNQDHISANKRHFICQWKECIRQEKPFKAQYMLVVHMRRHTGEKPHRCMFEGCNKAYSRLENLKTHMRSHTGEKPYLCEFPGCSKAFSNASDRAKHQNRTHSNQKPYVCKAPGCNKRYTDPSSLRKHVKTVHGAAFYANKKHKGENFDADDGYGGGGSQTGRTFQPEYESVSGNNNAGVYGKPNVEDCLVVTSLQHTSRSSKGSTDQNQDSQRPKHRNAKSKGPSKNGGNFPTPRNAGDDNVLPTNGSIGFQAVNEDEEIQEILDEILLPASTVSVGGDESCGGNVSRGVHPGWMKPKVGSMVPTLPPLGNTRRTFQPNVRNAALPNTSDFKARNQAIRRTTDNASLSSRELVRNSRRDSNTSTISSYMSSICSDASPCPPFSFQSESRRCSEASQNSLSHRSILESPYEYDINNGSVESGLGLSSLTNRMERAKIGSSTASLNASFGTERFRGHEPGSITRYLQRNQTGNNSRLPPINRGCMTPSRTPLPHEIPNHEIRRASDPVRCGISNVPVGQFQRCHSLNAVRPLPIPRLRIRHDSSTIASSCTSLATDQDQSEPEFDVDENHTLNEFSLEQNLLQDAFDSSEMIIPDEMQEFIESKYKQANDNIPAPIKPSDGQITRASCMYEGGNSNAGYLLPNGYGYTPSGSYPADFQRQQQNFDPYQNLQLSSQYQNFGDVEMGSAGNAVQNFGSAPSQVFDGFTSNFVNFESLEMESYQASPIVQSAGNDQIQLPTNHTVAQMSPGCNKVTSSTDVVNSANQANLEFDQLLGSFNPDLFMDSFCTASLENPMLTPTALINCSASMSSTPTMFMNCSSSGISSRMTTPHVDGKQSANQRLNYLDAPNMVVNDMNSILTQFDQENKCFSACR